MVQFNFISDPNVTLEDPLVLEDGSTWDRDVIEDPNALDGYILINNSYDWSYDLTRAEDAPPDTLRLSHHGPP